MQSLIDKNRRVHQPEEFKKEKEIDLELMEMVKKKKKAFRRIPKIVEERQP